MYILKQNSLIWRTVIILQQENETSANPNIYGSVASTIGKTHSSSSPAAAQSGAMHSVSPLDVRLPPTYYLHISLSLQEVITTAITDSLFKNTLEQAITGSRDKEKRAQEK